MGCQPRGSFLASVAPAAVVYLTFLVLVDAKLWRPGVIFTGRENIQIVEARSWWSGRLDLPERVHDTALHEGRIYSHFPPMFTLIAAALVPFFAGVPHWFVVVVLVLPLPWLAYSLFRRLTGSRWWAALLAIGLICGTSLWPVIDRTLRGGAPYQLNHTLAVLGTLAFLTEYFDRKRVWVAALGLLLATLSRQMTMALLIPLAWMALRRFPALEPAASRAATVRERTVVPGAECREERVETAVMAERRLAPRIVQLVAAVALIVGAPMLLNALKFGSPFETGYRLIYEGRDDGFARDAREHGLFSAAFVPRNLYYANLGFPRRHVITVAGREEVHWRPNVQGTGIWWTTPLLLWLFVDLRRILRDPARRALLLAAAVTYAALLFFHATGADQRGYNRFSLDYLPVLLAVVAPWACTGRRRWAAPLLVAWSVVYFRWMI